MCFFWAQRSAKYTVRKKWTLERKFSLSHPHPSSGLFVPKISYANEDWLTIHNPSHFGPVIPFKLSSRKNKNIAQMTERVCRQQRWSRIMNFRTIRAFLNRGRRDFWGKKSELLGRLIKKLKGRLATSGYECLHENENELGHARNSRKVCIVENKLY